MGAAAAKAIEDIDDTPGMQAEARLAVATHAVLHWNRFTGADNDDAGIWDAEATSLLSAVDEILGLKETQAFPMASPARRRMDSALGVAMSRLMDEFLSLRVWDASQLEGTGDLRVLDADGELSLTTDEGGTSTGELSLTTTGELHAPDRSVTSWKDVLTTFADDAFSDDLGLICPASLPVLHEIALRVIRAGYTKELLQTFTKAPCLVLDRCAKLLPRHALLPELQFVYSYYMDTSRVDEVQR